MSQETPATQSDDFTDAHIQRLLRKADRLGFGIRPAGFVLINRARLLEAEGISKANALLIDAWVDGAGGRIQALQREEPEVARKRYEPKKRPEKMVWAIPGTALKQ